MINTTIVVPAYGRIYDSVDQAKTDWINGKDFSIVGGGPYCSVRNIEKLQECLTSVYVYLPNLNKSFVVSSHFN